MFKVTLLHTDLLRQFMQSLAPSAHIFLSSVCPPSQQVELQYHALCSEPLLSPKVAEDNVVGMSCITLNQNTKIRLLYWDSICEAVGQTFQPKAKVTWAKLDMQGGCGGKEKCHTIENIIK